jgi:hypothetical protein
MKTVFRIITICSGLFLTKTSLAQTNDTMSINERIKRLIAKRDYDSIISYTLYFSFPPPPKPTVESLNNQSHYDDAFLVCFKNDSCFAICMAYYDSGIATSNRILIQAKPQINKLRKSWTKVKKEHFLPFIYKDTVNGKTRYDSLYVLHPTYGNLTFRSREEYESKDFSPVVTTKTASNRENINYKYNSSLSLFTVYTTIEHLYNSLIKQFVYHK